MYGYEKVSSWTIVFAFDNDVILLKKSIAFTTLGNEILKKIEKKRRISSTHSNGIPNAVSYVFFGFFHKCLFSFLIYYTLRILLLCDVNLHRKDDYAPTHYSGNFWWSKLEYIRKLDKCVYVFYISPEVWLTEKNIGKYLCLWNSNVNHYNSRYEKQNYAIE